jgi:hypothetical protein
MHTHGITKLAVISAVPAGPRAEQPFLQRHVSKRAAGRYRIDASRPLPKARGITYADLATALLDSLTRPDLYRRIAYIAS